MKPGPKTDPLLGPLTAKTLLLDELTVTQLKVLGGGNVSHGCRLASRQAFEHYQRTPDVPAEGVAP